MKITCASRLLVLVGALGLACGSGDASESGVELHLSSRVEGLDRLSLTVLDQKGALVVDAQLPESGPLELPGTVRIDRSGREGELRVLVWGLIAGARAAFAGGILSSNEAVDLLLDSPPVDLDEDGVPDVWDGCPGTTDPRQEDTNADGTTDACDGGPPVACPGNLLTNPGFEETLERWTGVDATLMRIAGGREGSLGAVKVCRNGSTARPATLENYPADVHTPPQGKKYRLEAWARAETPATVPVFPLIREVDVDDTQLGDSASSEVTVDSTWQKLATTYTVLTDQAFELPVEFTSPGATSGTCFVIDDVCLTEVP